MPTPSALIDFATLALVGLVAFVSLPLVADLSAWLIGAGLFGGSFVLSLAVSRAVGVRQRERRPDGEGAVD